MQNLNGRWVSILSRFVNIFQKTDFSWRTDCTLIMPSLPLSFPLSLRLTLPTALRSFPLYHLLTAHFHGCPSLGPISHVCCEIFFCTHFLQCLEPVPVVYTLCAADDSRKEFLLNEGWIFLTNGLQTNKSSCWGSSCFLSVLLLHTGLLPCSVCLSLYWQLMKTNINRVWDPTVPLHSYLANNYISDTWVWR